MRRASATRSSLAGHNAPFRRFLWEVPAAFVHVGRCIGPGGACMYTDRGSIYEEREIYMLRWCACGCGACARVGGSPPLFVRLTSVRLACKLHVTRPEHGGVHQTRIGWFHSIPGQLHAQASLG